MQPFKATIKLLALCFFALFAFASFAQQASPASARALAQADATASSQSASSQAEPAKAIVYVYRYREFTGSGLQPSVYCDDAALARIENGRYFAVKLDPGRHAFHSNDKQSGVELDLKAGQEYFLRVEIATGFWKGHGRIVTVMPEQGRYELKAKGLKPLDSDKVNDTARVSVEPAQIRKSADGSQAAK